MTDTYFCFIRLMNIQPTNNTYCPSVYQEIAIRSWKDQRPGGNALQNAFKKDLNPIS